MKTGYYKDYKQWIDNPKVIQLVKDALIVNQKCIELENEIVKYYLSIIQSKIDIAKTEEDIRDIKDSLCYIHGDLFAKDQLYYIINVKLKEIRGL